MFVHCLARWRNIGRDRSRRRSWLLRGFSTADGAVSNVGDQQFDFIFEGKEMASDPSGILVPAYDYPGEGDWDPLFAVAAYTRPGRLVVVANPGDGPGYDPETGSYREEDENYVRAIARVTGVCGTVIGYVHDCYGDTNPPNANNCPRVTEIADDIARWFDIYKVDGIFIDQTSATDQVRGEELISLVKGVKSDALVVLNAGTIPSLAFMEATDPAVVVVQEQSFEHFESWPPPGWVRDRANGDLSIPATRLAIIGHTPHNVEADVDLMVDVAREFHIGWVYANHANGSNYNALSTFLLPLGRRLCRLQSRFGLPCRIFTRPLCAASQLMKLVRSVTAFARPGP